jgi:hypothetical protein
VLAWTTSKCKAAADSGEPFDVCNVFIRENARKRESERERKSARDRKKRWS